MFVEDGSGSGGKGRVMGDMTGIDYMQSTYPYHYCFRVENVIGYRTIRIKRLVPTFSKVFWDFVFNLGMHFLEKYFLYTVMAKNAYKISVSGNYITLVIIIPK